MSTAGIDRTRESNSGDAPEFGEVQTKVRICRLVHGEARMAATPNDEQRGPRDDVQPNPGGIRRRCTSFESRRLCPGIQLYLRHSLGVLLHSDRAGPVRKIPYSWILCPGDWRKIMEFQKKEGVLVSYHILQVNNTRNGEPDLVLAGGIQGLCADRTAGRTAEKGRSDAAVRHAQGGRGVGRTQIAA